MGRVSSVIGSFLPWFDWRTSHAGGAGQAKALLIGAERRERGFHLIPNSLRIPRKRPKNFRRDEIS